MPDGADDSLRGEGSVTPGFWEESRSVVGRFLAADDAESLWAPAALATVIWWKDPFSPLSPRGPQAAQRSSDVGLLGGGSPLGKARGGAREGFLSWAGEGRDVTTGAASLGPRSSRGGGTPVGQGHKEAPGTCRTHQTRSCTRRARLCFVGIPGGSDGKASAYNVEDLGSIPGLGRSPGEGNGNLLQYSCLENPKDGGAW